MKSRRNVKKYIKKSFDNLYRDIIFYEAFAVNPDVAAARNIAEEIIDAESELISRVSVNEGKYVKGRMKHYFQKIDEDLQSKIDGISKKITALP